MNLSKMKLSESVVVRAAAKIQLSPGQRWLDRNNKFIFSVLKKYDRFWIAKDKFGDQQRFETPTLLKKIETEKLRLDPKSVKVDFLNEVVPIAKQYFNPLLCGLLLKGIKKILGESSYYENNKSVNSSTAQEKSAEAGEDQNEALLTLTDIYADLNNLTRITFASAPSEIRNKSVQATNEVRELLDLVISRLPLMK